MQGLRNNLKLLYPLNFSQFFKESFSLDTNVLPVGSRGGGHLCGVPTVLMVPMLCWGRGFLAETLWCYMAQMHHPSSLPEENMSEGEGA